MSCASGGGGGGVVGGGAVGRWGGGAVGARPCGDARAATLFFVCIVLCLLVLNFFSG